MEFARPFSVLDGGLSSALELAGHDLSGELWTARLLTEAPDAIVTAHLGFLRAGAEVLITSSYQASIAGFIGAGISRSDAVTLIGLTTELAREAVVRHRREATHPTDPLVAASVGPYGAVLADGSEYTGVYDLSAGDLAEFHRARLEFLIASEPDLLAAETIPSLAEARAVIDAFGRLPAMPSWISFSCRDGATTCAGDPIEAAIAVACSSPQVIAVGVNCSAPGHIGELLERAATVTSLPLVAYSNSGQRWDPRQRCWTGEQDPFDDAPMLDRWIAAGARLIGGCCGTAFDEIRSLRNRRDALLPDPLEPEAA